MGIRDMIYWSLIKNVMSTSGEQANMVCGNFQLCAGLEAGIEVVDHAMGKKRRERTKRGREEESGDEAEYEEE